MNGRELITVQKTSKKSKLTPVLSQFLLFASVGAVGTVSHFAILIILVHVFSSPPVPSSAAGFVFGALVNYNLNYFFTFKSQKPHGITLFKFFTVAVFGLGLNIIIMMVATEGIHYLLSQVLATGFVLVWNFACNRFWTFKDVSYGS